MSNKLYSQRGVALTLAIIVIVMIAILTAWTLRLAYNYQVLTSDSALKRTRAYYRAQAGIVDANWRIRNNIGGDFTDPKYNPPAYPLDIDDDGITDVTVDIDPFITIAKAGPLETHVITSVGSDH